MNKKYFIKVGIEEFEIDEKDVPRVLKAMQENLIVMLKMGAFRGSAIISCTSREVPIELPPAPRVPEYHELEKKYQREAAQGCSTCTATGVIIVTKENGERVARMCSCQNVRARVLQAIAESTKDLEKYNAEYLKKP